MEELRIQFRLFTANAIEESKILDNQIYHGNYEHFREILLEIHQELEHLKKSRTYNCSILIGPKGRKHLSMDSTISSHIEVIDRFLDGRSFPPSWLYSLFQLVMYYESRKVYHDDWVYMEPFTFEINFLDEHLQRFHDDLFYERYRTEELGIYRAKIENNLFPDSEYYLVSSDYLLKNVIVQINANTTNLKEFAKYFTVLDEVSNNRGVLLIDKNIQ